MPTWQGHQGERVQFTEFGALITTALAAVTANGSSTAIDLVTPYRTHTLQTVVTGAPTSLSVTLEGSLNGTNWVVLATSTSTTGDAQFAVDKPVRYVRATLSALTGGTAPTVTALIASVE